MTKEQYRGDPNLRRWIFKLDKKLRLNLTLHHIHFGFRHLHTCAVGELKVISDSNNKQVFKYCGIHSNMINYPQNRNVHIFLTNLDDRPALLG